MSRTRARWRCRPSQRRPWQSSRPHAPEATRAGGVFGALLDGPAGVGQRDQTPQRRVQGQVGQPAEGPLALARFARHGALTQPPPLWAGGGPVMGGAAPGCGAAGGAMHAHGDKLRGQGRRGPVPPGHRCPRRVGQALEQGVGRPQRRWPGLAGAAFPRGGWRWGRGHGRHLVRQAPPEVTGHADDVGQPARLQAPGQPGRWGSRHRPRRPRRTCRAPPTPARGRPA